MKYFNSIALILIISSGISGQNTSNYTDFINKEINGQSTNNRFDHFVTNQGQWDDKIQYKSSIGGASVSFLQNGISFANLRENEDLMIPEEVGKPAAYDYEVMVFNLEFINPSDNSSIVTHGATKSNINYLMGKPENHVKGAITAPRIAYNGIWEGVDLHYYSNLGKLKYDLVLSPNTAVDIIQFRYDGVNNISISRGGELEIETKWGVVLEDKPYSYQFVNGEKKEVDIRFELKGNNTFGFKVYGDYDPSKELVIDPIVMEWSTWLGGTGTSDNAYIYGVALDDKGDVYGTGKYPANFPVSPGVFQSTFKGKSDIFVAGFSRDGQTLKYATYIGGMGHDIPNDIKANNKGEVFITGYTTSNDFPTTTNAYRTVAPGTTKSNVFVLRLSDDGSSLIYSTYLGSGNTDQGKAIAINANDEAFVTGYTGSPAFPTTSGAFQTTRKGNQDAFVSKFSADGSTLLKSTLIGGTRDQRALGLAINAADEVFISGTTRSADYPTTVGAYRRYNSSLRNEVFITRLSADFSTLIASTYIGGSEDDGFLSVSIDVDANNNVYVCGDTRSMNFPTTINAPDRQFNTTGSSIVDSEGYAFKMNANLGTLIYSTLLGGGMGETMDAIAVNSKGEAYVVGYTGSDDYPTTTCAYDKIMGSTGGRSDMVMTKISAAGDAFIYSSYFGNKYNEYYADIALYEKENCVEEVTLTVTSHSLFFPVKNAYQRGKLNSQDEDQPVFFKLKPEVEPAFEYSPPACQASIQFTDKTTGNCVWGNTNWTPSTWYWNFGDGNSSTQQNPQHQFAAAGDYKVMLVVTCPRDTIIQTVSIPSDPGLNVDLGNDISMCTGSTVTLDAGNSATVFIWSTGATTQSIDVTAPGVYWVEAGTGSGCPVIDSIRVSFGIDVELNLNPAQFCEGETAIIDAGNQPSGAQYLWSTGETTSSISITNGGSYWLELTNGNCIARDTVTAVENKVDLVIGETKSASCGVGDGEAIAVVNSGKSPYSFSWDDPDNQKSDTAIGLETGDYTVTVVDANGCTDVATATIVNVGGLEIKISSIVDNGCDRFGGNNGAAVVKVISGNAPYTYLWDDANQQTTDSAVGLAIGTYAVLVTDKNGCVQTDTAMIEAKIKIEIAIDAHASCASCSDGILTANATGTGEPPYTYRWNDTDDQTTATATGLGTGTYVVTVTDANGCYTTDTVTIGVTGLENLVQNVQMNVYPNPGSGTMYLEFSADNLDAAIFNLYDATGRITIRILLTSDQLARINIAHLPEGLYYYTVLKNNRVFHTGKYVLGSK